MTNVVSTDTIPVTAGISLKDCIDFIAYEQPTLRRLKVLALITMNISICHTSKIQNVHFILTFLLFSFSMIAVSSPVESAGIRE